MVGIYFGATTVVSTLPWPLWISTSHIQQYHCKCVLQRCFHPTSRITQHKDNLYVCPAVLLCVSCSAAFTRPVGSHNTKTICMCVLQRCFHPTSRITQHKDNLYVCPAVLLCVSCSAVFTRPVGSHNTKTICMCVLQCCFHPHNRNSRITQHRQSACVSRVSHHWLTLQALCA